MSKLEDKIRAQQFRLVTNLQSGDVRSAAGRAAAAGKRTMGSSIVEDASQPGSTTFRVKGPGKLVTQMVLLLTWEAAPNGGLLVTLQVGDYLTTRPTVFGFVPIGPSQAPGLWSLQRFSEWMKRELGAVA